jgi:hypothetical protein
MFATCLPREIVLRVWDSLLLEGSEILLKTGLAIWGKLSRYKYHCIVNTFVNGGS